MVFTFSLGFRSLLGGSSHLVSRLYPYSLKWINSTKMPQKSLGICYLLMIHQVKTSKQTPRHGPSIHPEVDRAAGRGPRPGLAEPHRHAGFEATLRGGRRGDRGWGHGLEKSLGNWEQWEFLYQLIGFMEKLQENSLDFIGKSMVSCRFSLKSTHW